MLETLRAGLQVKVLRKGVVMMAISMLMLKAMIIMMMILMAIMTQMNSGSSDRG